MFDIFKKRNRSSCQKCGKYFTEDSMMSCKQADCYVKQYRANLFSRLRNTIIFLLVALIITVCHSALFHSRLVDTRHTLAQQTNENVLIKKSSDSIISTFSAFVDSISADRDKYTKAKLDSQYKILHKPVAIRRKHLKPKQVNFTVEEMKAAGLLKDYND